MINNIRCSKFQNLTTGWGRFSEVTLSFRDFRVLYDSWFTVFENDEADWFIWGTFSDYFCCYVEVVDETVADECWVCDTDETVVYAVCVEVLDVSLLKVGED